MHVLYRFAVGFALLAATAAPAAATTLAELTLDQMTDAADLIVRGNVDSVWTDLDDKGRVRSYALVRIDAALKGEADPGDYVTVETPGGVYEGAVVDTALAARYSPGEDVFLFLDELRFGTAWGSIGLYLGKYTVKIDPATGQDMVVRFTVPWTREFDARFVPNPPKSERVSLRTMEDTVRLRVATGWDGQPIPGVSDEHLRAINHLQPGVR